MTGSNKASHFVTKIKANALNHFLSILSNFHLCWTSDCIATHARTFFGGWTWKKNVPMKLAIRFSVDETFQVLIREASK